MLNPLPATPISSQGKTAGSGDPELAQLTSEESFCKCFGKLEAKFAFNQESGERSELRPIIEDAPEPDLLPADEALEDESEIDIDVLHDLEPEETEAPDRNRHVIGKLSAEPNEFPKHDAEILKNDHLATSFSSRADYDISKVSLSPTRSETSTSMLTPINEAHDRSQNPRAVGVETIGEVSKRPNAAQPTSAGDIGHLTKARDHVPNDPRPQPVNPIQLPEKPVLGNARYLPNIPPQNTGAAKTAPVVGASSDAKEGAPRVMHLPGTAAPEPAQPNAARSANQVAAVAQTMNPVAPGANVRDVATDRHRENRLPAEPVSKVSPVPDGAAKVREAVATAVWRTSPKIPQKPLHLPMAQNSLIHLDKTVSPDLHYDDSVALQLLEPRGQSHVSGPAGLPNLQKPELPIHIGRQLAEGLARSGDRPIEIRLNPVELGSVRMTITAAETGVVVNILAERGDTLDLMRRNIDELGRAFSEIGYESIEFAFADGNQAREDRESKPESAFEPNPVIVEIKEEPRSRPTARDAGSGPGTNRVDVRL